MEVDDAEGGGRSGKTGLNQFIVVGKIAGREGVAC